MTHIIGIDLGTTNSEVSIVQDGKIKVIEVDGVKVFPSFVGLADDGAILVGESARNQYQLYPERTIRSVKRKMGEDVMLSLGAKQYSPQEVSAIILKRLKLGAEEYLGCPVHKAVITVPAYFSDAQRQATREAGEIAGLEVVKMINEPTAAALSYEGSAHHNKRVLVYDLGGGTFDVSVVQIENGVIEVVASHGNNQLGGDDFDAKIQEHILDHIEYRGREDELSHQALARIDRAAEAAKRHLSDHPFVQISEEYLFEKDGSPYNLSLELSRSDYEEMLAPLVEDTFESIHTALDSAGLRAVDIDEILLVGGSTRTPYIQQRLSDDFGKTPRADIDPELGVAIGAAMQAAIIAGDLSATVLVDITPYTFGTSAMGELEGERYPYFYVPIIKKNTPIPVTKSELFYTMYDDQEEVQVSIYQGEHLDAKKNILLGEFMISGLSKVPSGNEIITELSLDKDGILNVSCVEKKTGLKKGITINKAMSRYDSIEIDRAKEKIANLFDEEIDVVSGGEVEDGGLSGRALVQAEALIEKAERMMAQVSQDDKEDMTASIEAIKDAMLGNDEAVLKESMEELSDILYYLES